ncbi:hypothetical protein [Ideonella paludis]|uniref:hypothetical protein n=1 Tax=Ideonella paludis TaxID=1233411 RepID=UPI00363BBB97
MHSRRCLTIGAPHMQRNIVARSGQLARNGQANAAGCPVTKVTGRVGADVVAERG